MKLFVEECGMGEKEAPLGRTMSGPGALGLRIGYLTVIRPFIQPSVAMAPCQPEEPVPQAA